MAYLDVMQVASRDKHCRGAVGPGRRMVAIKSSIPKEEGPGSQAARGGLYDGCGSMEVFLGHLSMDGASLLDDGVLILVMEAWG